MRLIDQEYTRHPFYGRRRMTPWLVSQGHYVNEKRVRRLMRLMGLEAIYPKPRTSQPAGQYKKYPYLLRGITANYPNHIWSTDITYIRMKTGFMYLSAVIDWYSRYVLSWKLSNSLDSMFCIDALKSALKTGSPLIFNTDQGAQFTSKEFTGCLEEAGIQISMDGRGRALDNVFVERLWRSVKYEHVYLHEYECVNELYSGLDSYFKFYNEERPHQSLGYTPPYELHFRVTKK